MTDLDVYLRAAWAVREGQDFYTITDDNGWHYHYPPLFAILLVPLADPPPGYDRQGSLPFAGSVAIWYVISVGCLFLAVHWLASALEDVSLNPGARNPSRGCRRWWLLRALPVLACLSPIAHSLVRGQVNMLLLLLFSGLAVAWLRGRRWQAGWFLAGAICLKVIPAFLVLYPLWRRDWRCLAGCGLGLIVGLGLVPLLVFGPTRTLAYYREWDEVLRQPALAEGADQTRAKELIEVTATDSQSYLAIIHNTIHLDRATRPNQASRLVRWAHWGIGAALTGLTLLAAGWQPPRSKAAETVFLGLLIVMMCLLSPVCHLHYFSLALPLIMALLAVVWENPQTLRLGAGWWALLGINLVSNALTGVPGLEVLRDVGVAAYMALLLWLTGTLLVGKYSTWRGPAQASSPEASGLAA
jgi:hypothetical protein